MTILHVITGLQKAAGTTTFVENVVREQRSLGHTVDIVTNANQGEKFHHSSFLTPTSNFDVVHIHGLWSMLLHRASHYARHRHIPVVWSTHGMTAPWSLHHKWWKKCLPWCLYQKPDLKRAALIHCTTDLEADWNHALGFTNTFIAPLGTNLPENRSRLKVEYPPTEGSREAGAMRGVDNGEKILLYVGRIYPVKALDNAIRAVALMKQPINLRIVGPDQAGHQAELEKLANDLGVRDKIDFAGPRYDAELSAEYDACDGLILVSHTENFGATVVDAMAHGKPVITSTKTPWSIVQGRKSNNSTIPHSSFLIPHSAPGRCGWWVDNSPESLARTFDEFASTSTSDLNLLGQNGLALVKQSYTWPAIARNLLSQYQSLTSNPQPLTPNPYAAQMVR